MKITALVENTTTSELRAKHGLSLYMKTKKHKILFDLGPDGTLFANATTRGIDLAAVDVVILSHGHIDHGGALERFLQINTHAKVYVQKCAFEPHYSKLAFLRVSVGLDTKTVNHPQIVLLDGDYTIDDELSLFTVTEGDKCYSEMNDVLYEGKEQDDFLHEQNLLVKENCVALVMGCGHKGVVNIMDRAARYEPRVCIGGYHLFNPLTKKTVDDVLLNGIAAELQKYPEVQFYTCHCTGRKAYDYLARKVPQMHYLSCGQVIDC